MGQVDIISDQQGFGSILPFCLSKLEKGWGESPLLSPLSQVLLYLQKIAFWVAFSAHIFLLCIVTPWFWRVLHCMVQVDMMDMLQGVYGSILPRVSQNREELPQSSQWAMEIFAEWQDLAQFFPFCPSETEYAAGEKNLLASPAP